MSAESFAAHLALLDEGALEKLLAKRPDVRVEPVPAGFVELAQRLGGAASLGEALIRMNRDEIVVGQAVAVLGDSATVAGVAQLLGAPGAMVRQALAGLYESGLAWNEGDRVQLPRRLAEHWAAELGGGRPMATLARSVLLDDLRTAAQALGVAAAGLRKGELVSRLVEATADIGALARTVRALPVPVRERLDERRYGLMIYFGYPTGADSRDAALAAAGLLLRVSHSWELPREVAVAAWLAERELLLTGRPAIAHAEVDGAVLRSASQAAVQATLTAMTTLLDAARSKAITALKQGGVGSRERGRLASRLSLPAESVMMCLDLAYAAGLLGETEGGYAPTRAYPDWRAAEPARQWAVLASAWLRLDHAPTSREVDDGREQPPPLPLVSAAGPMRRALLAAVADGESVAATAEQIDWFFPLHGYEDGARKDKVAAAIREAELLGVVAADRLTECGRHLVALGDGGPEGLDELAQRAADLLPANPCTVIVQSDLTAVVSGQPSLAVSNLLSAAAVKETAGTAAVWRFTPTSVRGALDAGWTASGLLSELAAMSDRPLPQPLEYLVADVARRHGAVRVRGMRSCVLADEATVAELLHTRSLQSLHLAQLAPTVLSSPFELDEVLARLRSAGLCPVAEDALGVVIVETREEQRAAGPARLTPVGPPRLTALELARRLRSASDAGYSPDAGSATVELLARLGAQLDDAELRLLGHAIDHEQDVRIEYRDKNGSRTIRQIQPRQIYGRWLDSWCRLRDAQRDFAIANIESVGPPI
ncbi:MAG TPA: helicase-associated domain-containing protein [Pseudonocardiaceae bacterium]|nr:helicase-associated domain-containing protein [Pseudonocardiaceae bacterium]